MAAFTRFFEGEVEEEQVYTPWYRFPDLPENRGNHSFNLFLPPRYIIGPTVGVGEFAKVKLSYNMTTGAYVAVKCFNTRSGQYMMLDEQIMREMLAMKGLAHQHLLKLHEVILHGDKVFLVTEYCPYGDMRRFINQRGPLTELQAREFLGHLCMGVQKMHSLDLVHRDLKLENVLIDSKFRAKIGDFGCARRQIGKRLHTITGSYAYGAPELVRGDSYDGKKCDVWSLGVILYAMVAGKLPYSDKGRLRRLLRERMRPPTVPSQLTTECGDLIRGMLTYNAAKRLALDAVVAHAWMLHSSLGKEE